MEIADSSTLSPAEGLLRRGKPIPFERGLKRGGSSSPCGCSPFSRQFKNDSSDPVVGKRIGGR